MSLSHRHAVIDALMAVLDEEHAMAVYEFRRVTKRAPLTEYGARRLAKKLAAWGDANEAADIMIDRCWQGFEVEWALKHARPSRPSGVMGAAMDIIGADYGSESHSGDQRAFERLPPGSRH